VATSKERPLLLLHHRGARSGESRVTPLMYRTEGSAVVVFASNAGSPSHPAWFHNLRAHPETEIEIGTDRRAVISREAPADRRDRLWEAQKRDAPQFEEYEVTAGRAIPVIVLEPRSDADGSVPAG
jgi:deazaflavin-dependent oxidoreductase (nitroreductase family)